MPTRYPLSRYVKLLKILFYLKKKKRWGGGGGGGGGDGQNDKYMKFLHRWNRFAKSSYTVEFRWIPR